jgi:alpha-1,3-rhamnosyltransferase
MHSTVLKNELLAVKAEAVVPLVSIIVATYNSAAYVVETLESAKEQSWGNLELVISDDCSSDDTISLCKAWVKEHSERFASVQILTVPKNTGVSANCNRAIKACQSAWIKIIAGDDILFPNCIADNMQFVGEHPGATIIFSQVHVYKDNFKSENIMEVDPDRYPSNLMDPAFSAEEQFKLLLLSDRINYTPSYFFNRATILNVGGYDEENRLVEDYPMWLKLTGAGNKLFYFHKATVGYRRHHQASNNVVDYGLFKPLLLKSGPLKKHYVYPYLPWDIASSERYIFRVSKLFQKVGLNKKTAVCSFLYKVSTIYANPFRYLIFFKKKVLKAGRNDIFYRD